MGAMLLNDVNAICSARQLADVLGLTIRQVHSLQTEGVLRSSRRGKVQGFKLSTSVQAYLRHQHDYVKKKYSSSGDHAYTDARSRRMAAIAAIEEGRAKALSGEYIKRARVVYVMTSLLTQVKNHMLGVPARVTRRLIGQKDAVKIRTILDEAVRNCLREAAKFGDHSFDETGKNGARSVVDAA
jgi:phage terminase Nu1 subunit (DNA packaging protein)